MPAPACTTSRFLNGCHWLRQCSSAVLLLIALASFAGCPKADQSQPNQQPKPSDAPPATRASVALRVLVVNDPPLVEAINRLRGEWAERSGGELNAVPAKWADVSQAKSID